MSFLPHYCHSFHNTVIPSEIFVIPSEYCYSFRIIVISNICHPEQLQYPPIPEERENCKGQWGEISFNTVRILNIHFWKIILFTFLQLSINSIDYYLSNNSFTDPFFIVRNAGINSGCGAAIFTKGNNSCQFVISVSIWTNQGTARITIAGSCASLSGTDHTGFNITLENSVTFFLVYNVNFNNLEFVWRKNSTSGGQAPT